MGHEKFNNVDKTPYFYPQLQNTEDIGLHSLSNEAVCCTGITGVGTIDIPLNVSLNCPFQSRDMPLKDIDSMTDASQLYSYKNFMVDPHLMNRIDYMTCQYSTLQNIAANSRGLQMSVQGAKMDNSKPQSTGNFMSCRSKEHLLWGAQDGRKMESNSNDVVDCVVQSDYPETLDGSFLTLGVDVNTESRTSLNASSRDFIGKIDETINLQLNPSHGQSGYGSSFSHDLKMATDLSDFPTHADGFSSMEEKTVGLSSLKHSFGGLSSIMQNAGESTNVSAFAGTMENVDDCSLSDYDLGVAGSASSYFSLSPFQMLPMPQSHVPHPSLAPGDQKFGAGFANVDLNQGLHDLSGVSSMVHSSSQSGLPPNQGFHNLSGISPIEHSSSQSGLPVQGQLRMAPRPSLPSFMTVKYDMASNQPQRCNMGSIPSLSGTSVSSPVLGNIESASSQYPSDKLFASEGIAAEVVSIVPSFNNIGVQAASQIIPVAGECPPAMTSNLLARPSLKRKAAQTPPATPQVQVKRTSSAKPSILSSTLYKAPNTPFVAPLPVVVSQAATIPSRAQPISSVPPVLVTACSLPPLACKGRPLPSISQMSRLPHIKWQDTELLQLSGFNCLLCKRDLSYTPEGPVFQPAARPTVAVLSCGHCFHDLCLQRITSKDEANNPPCIPCVIGES